jgi:acetylornithine/succinyldiaminopimelate/putrescine aminotransferase
MWGLQLKVDATPIIDGARERGLIVNRTHEKVVRMLPPLNIEKADLDRAAGILDQVFASVPAEVKA